MNTSFASEVRGLYRSGVEIMYYMRGALSKAEMVDLTAWERDIFVEFLKERLEEEKKKAKWAPQQMVY
jgi:hypothetical protein